MSFCLARYQRGSRPAPPAPAFAAVSAAAAEAALRLGPGFVDRQGPTAHLELIELRSSLLGFLVGRHLHERETTRAARGGIAHHSHRLDRSRPAEKLLEFGLACRVGKISDVKPATHTCH